MREGNVSPHQLWTEKWRPKLAAEVLGNEKSASYLRDWLRALTLEIGELASPDGGEKGKGKGKGTKITKGVKRPRVVRAVDKRERKRRRIDSDDEDDSWIAYDDESEEEIPTENEEEQDVKVSSNGANTFGQLTNTIILAGPPGSGKTACVYACAEELAWDVFEVYPGIGKRNGASIDNLIGDVGKNHLVRKVTTRPGNVDEDLNGYFGFLESAKLENSSTTPRQSFVLLEEVDILFKDDSNFWPAVVNFLRDCRRPVICTCNDISLVPLSDLPVQNVLAFEPCPPKIAASYLQAVCCSEGWFIDRETVTQLYEAPYETISDTSQAAPDLRRAMHRLQLWCCASHEAKRGGISHEDPVWRSLPKQVEMLSSLDGEKLAYGLSSEVKLQCYYMDVYAKRTQTTERSMDDEVGYTILYDEGLEFGDGHVPIISHAMRRARGRDDGKMEWLLVSQREYEKRIREGLGGMVPMGAVGRERMHTEYAAYVRQMVEGEDEQEARMAGEGSGSGRSTRNSRRYERVVWVGEAERRQLGWR
ncbi:P-loop containing nucleoside triphosphate hydrolase protein [Amanita rubescens]|nr:P-loop containing nucleoside triphosphate hydrolase protein [Amanita rubescens]